MYKNLTLDNLKDNRSIFANKIFAMLYDQYLGNITNEAFIKEAKEFYEQLEEYVRNIYECIDTEIPVMLYLDILKAKNMEDIGLDAFTKEEALVYVKDAIHKLYQ